MSLRLALSAALLVVACSRSGVQSAQADAVSRARPSARPAEIAAAPAAVVELFTSEGCSSCPSADKTLAALTAEAERSGRRVFTLELHVDYWNDLGWVDPFSAPIHSLRQGAYAKAFGLSGIYTPQMVVNGRDEFVGSHGARATSAVESALRVPARAAVNVRANWSSVSPPTIRVDYDVASDVPLDLKLAAAEDQVATQVTRGENAGRSLQHRHVVRAFESRRLAESKAGTWTLPWRGAPGTRVVVVAYATDPETLAVVGASAASLSASASSAP